MFHTIWIDLLSNCPLTNDSTQKTVSILLMVFYELGPSIAYYAIWEYYEVWSNWFQAICGAHIGTKQAQTTSITINGSNRYSIQPKFYQSKNTPQPQLSRHFKCLFTQMNSSLLSNFFSPQFVFAYKFIRKSRATLAQNEMLKLIVWRCQRIQNLFTHIHKT